MEHLVGTVMPYIAKYGYWAVFFGVFLESLGVPLPGETLLVIGALVAAQGKLNLGWVFFLSLLATFLANNLSYSIGYFGGQKFVVKFGKYIFINEVRLAKLKKMLEQHTVKVIISSRFILGLRQANGLIIGTIRIPWKRYAVLNLIGALLWVICWILIPYSLSKSFSIGFEFLQYFYLLSTIILIVALFWAYRIFKQK